MGCYPSANKEKIDNYTTKYQVILAGKEQINHDSYMFRFEFKDPNIILNTVATSHVRIL